MSRVTKLSYDPLNDPTIPDSAKSQIRNWMINREGVGKLTVSNNAKELLKEIELPEYLRYKGKTYFVYDSQGKITHIKCQDPDKGRGVTIGYGSFIPWDIRDQNGKIIGKNTKALDKLKKYGITYKMSVDELYNIKVPIEDCEAMFETELQDKADVLLNTFIEPNGIKLDQQQFDALVIHKYLAGYLGINTQNYLEYNTGNYTRGDLKNAMMNDLKKQTDEATYNRNKTGWENRVDNEMNIFFDHKYNKTF